jgi:radical SAM protein with 4Fe4S-binding SPASM domain
VFSVDAASEPAYSRLRVGGTLERGHANIERFHAIRRTRYPHSRTITRVSGVKVPGTPGIEEMEGFWGDVVDQVAFVTYNPWENTYERPLNDLTTPCSDLWRRMFVWWDGTVNPCDVDYKSTLAVGNVREQSLGDLWRSARYETLRSHHLAQRRSHCSPCNRCTVI